MNRNLPIFLSVVFVMRNQQHCIEEILLEASALISNLVADYEVIVVDNASNDESLTEYKKLTSENGQPNLQFYMLSNEVDSDTAFWVGLENALGDYVAVIDPITDDISLLPKMLDKAVCGADVVFAKNDQSNSQGFIYDTANSIFNAIYKYFTGVNLVNDAPRYRVLNKRVVNFILQHPQPALTYRHLPATSGFQRVNMKYSATPRHVNVSRLGDGIDRGIRLLVSTTRAPMRLVTYLSMFGAVVNLIYSIYVLVSAVLKSNIAPGWVSLSLQQSGMFFLISLVLLILGEYILQMASISNEGPPYQVVQEFSSARITRREKLNIEDVLSMKRPIFNTMSK